MPWLSRKNKFIEYSQKTSFPYSYKNVSFFSNVVHLFCLIHKEYNTATKCLCENVSNTFSIWVPSPLYSSLVDKWEIASLDSVEQLPGLANWLSSELSLTWFPKSPAQIRVSINPVSVVTISSHGWLAVNSPLWDVYLRLEDQVFIKEWSGVEWSGAMLAMLAPLLIMACVLPLSCLVDSL